MFNLLNWFYSNYIYGPARNAPNNGVEIKKFVDSKPTEVKTITEQDLTTAISKLNKIEVNSNKSPVYTSPLLKEFDEVFNMGYKNYFEQLKLKRQR